MFDLNCPTSHVSLTGCVQLPIPAIGLEKATNDWDMAIWPQCNVLYQSGYIYAFYTKLSSPNAHGGREIMRIRKWIGTQPNSSWEDPITSYRPSGTLNATNVYLSASCTGADGKFWIAFTEGTSSGTYLRLKSSVNQGSGWTGVGDINFTSSDAAVQTAAYSLIDDVDNLLVGFRISAGADAGRVGIYKVSKTNASIISNSTIDIIGTGIANASGWINGARYTEPMLIRDPIVTGRIVGWLRHNDDVSAKPMWAVSNNNGLTWSTGQYTPVGLDARQLNLPVVRIGDNYVTLAAERYNNHRIQTWSIPVADTINGASLTNLTVKKLGSYPGRDNSISSDPSSNAGGTSFGNVAYFVFGAIDTDSYKTPSNTALGPANLWSLSLDYDKETSYIKPEDFHSIKRKPVRIFDGEQVSPVLVSPNTLHINTSSTSATIFQLENIGEVGDFVEFLSIGAYGFKIQTGSDTTLVRATGQSITNESFVKPGGDKRIVVLQKIGSNIWMECGLEAMPFVSDGVTTEGYKYIAASGAGRIGFYFGGTQSANKAMEVFSDGLRIRNENKITHWVKASATWAPGEIAAGGTAITGLTMVGANTSGTSRYITVYPPVKNGVTIWGEVSGNNVVNLNAFNPTAGAITPTVTTYQLIFMSAD